MYRLVITANRPEMEMAYPAIPELAWRSLAIGVSRLTGMNSAAISKPTHIAMEPTAPQFDWELKRPKIAVCLK